MKIRYLRLLFSFLIALVCLQTVSCGDSPQASDIQVSKTDQYTNAPADTEDFPLPNCGGSGELKQTLGTQASVKKSVVITGTATVSGGVTAGIPGPVQSQLEAAISIAYSETFQNESSRLDSIELKAAPGTYVVYVIQWVNQNYYSTVSYILEGKPNTADYVYTLRVPKMSGSYSIDCSITPPVKPNPTAVTTSTTATHPEGMVLIPAGVFTMGNNLGQQGDGPEHEVILDAFYIDAYEVTNASYAKFVSAAGSIYEPSNLVYYDDPNFANYPVITVSWDMAAGYCQWRGARLPTEAEWEKAARGTDGLPYPWGEEIDCTRANYDRCNIGRTTAVGSYPNGRSPYGVYDMAGNAWEWVQDWYDVDYYSELPPRVSNPLGPVLDLGWGHVMRGGSWLSGPIGLKTSYRSNFAQMSYTSVGFRCAREARP
jgi:formylglycine-generating enzyme required for sulfatase activity